MIRIERATESHVPLILQFIRELAAYEKMDNRVTATEERLRATLFGQTPYAHAVIAYDGEEAVAFAVYLFTYSTFSATRGLYLEDILVRPAYRRTGIGQQLFSYLSEEALAHGCTKLELAVLNWNELAMNFYKKLGGAPVDEWTVFRLPEEALRSLAEN